MLARPMYVAVAVVFAIASDSFAFTAPAPKRTETQSGVVKYATMQGTYTLAANEIVTRCQFTYNGGFCDCTQYCTKTTYSASMGSFDLKTYRCDFWIKNTQTGVTRQYSSPTYTWGVK